MDATTLRIAAAALLHDIGKLADGVEPSGKELDEFCPVHEGRRFHRHAACTAAFLKEHSRFLPSRLLDSGEEQDSLIDLAARHHRPISPLQWVVAEADRISNGMSADQWATYNRTPDRTDARNLRLVPIFEGLRRPEEAEPAYFYPVGPISSQNIFPQRLDEIGPSDAQDAPQRRKELSEEFLQGFKALPHRQENAALWLEHLDSLLLVHASHIPASLVEGGVPDVSLYDHLQTAAALAPALYLFHKEAGTLEESLIRGGSEQKKFIFATGSFYGIQNFIFRTRGISQRYRSKLLRGRSAVVSILSELAADLLCRRLGLPSASVLLNAAGKFTVIAPNTPTAHAALEEVERKINDWLMRGSYGETAMGLSRVEVSPDDLTEGRLSQVWEERMQSTAESKLLRIDFGRQGGAFEGFLNSFNNDVAQRLCPFCGKRPSDLDCEGRGLIGDEGSSCRWCLDHVFLGSRLVKKDRLIVVRSSAKGPYGKGLMDSIFDEYQLGFASEKNHYADWAASGKLVKYWGIGLNGDRLPEGATVRLIQGHAPVYSEDDPPAAKDGDQDEPKVGDLKTFEDIALRALSVSEDGKLKGVEALAALKADVDHLGLLMTCGLRDDRLTLARLSALSRQMDLFFTLWLPHFLETSEDFCDTYTVFAGGDDLLLIGPWNRMRCLAVEISRKFSEYTCCNAEIHLSAGISLHRAGASVAQMARASEEALKAAKRPRNSLTVFDETAGWDELDKLEQYLHDFEHWRSSGWLGGAMMHRFNDFIRLAEEERQLRVTDSFTLDRLQCLKWRAHFSYAVGRNVGLGLEVPERDQAVRKVSEAAGWLEIYGSKMKIPLWEYLYNQRTKRETR